MPGEESRRQVQQAQRKRNTRFAGPAVPPKAADGAVATNVGDLVDLVDLRTGSRGQRSQLEHRMSNVMAPPFLSRQLQSVGGSWHIVCIRVLMSCGLTPPLVCSEWLSGRLSLCQDPLGLY